MCSLHCRGGFLSAIASNITFQSRNVLSKKFMNGLKASVAFCPQLHAKLQKSAVQAADQLDVVMRRASPTA